MLMNIRMNFIVCIQENNMDELEFQIVTKYVGRLKQELQDEIIDVIWDMGIAVTNAKKLKNGSNVLFLKFNRDNSSMCIIDQKVWGLKTSRKLGLVVVSEQLVQQ